MAGAVDLPQRLLSDSFIAFKPTSVIATDHRGETSTYFFSVVLTRFPFRPV